MNNIQLPPAFEARMRLQLGESWSKFETALSEPPLTSVRRNPLKSNLFHFDRVGWSRYGYYLNSRPRFTFDPLFHAGTYYVQEASSMFLEQALIQSVDMNESLRVLDLCAAPGGKSTHLLSLISKDSILVTNEVIRARATILAENIQKWGYQNVVVTQNDPSDFERLPGFFDVIVTDAPCSGEGLFRKEPEAISEWSINNIQLCRQRQQRILADCWTSLKENGILIYCTCTYSEEENELTLDWLNEEKSIEFISLNTEKDWNVDEIRIGKAVGYRFYPHRVKGEGFFIAIVRKTEPQDSIYIKSKTSFHSPVSKIRARLQDWQTVYEDNELIQLDDLILSVFKNQIHLVDYLNRTMKVIQKGTAVATLKHDKLIPEHAFALSVEINSDRFTQVSLTLEQAISYLKKELLYVDEPKKGFALAMYENIPLGWMNILGNRINNLYPANWRIRTSG